MAYFRSLVWISRANRKADLAFTPKQQLRHLSLHEYHSQQLLREYNVPIPRGEVATTPSEVRSIADGFGGSCVVKSQILRGGRGKGRFQDGLQGGIQTAKTGDEAASLASKMLGQRLITKQTGHSGLPVNKVYVTEAVKYDDEWYLAMTIDRENYSPAVILSKSGGVDIESVTANSPEKLSTFPFGISTGITPELLGRIAQRLGIDPTEMRNLNSTLQGLYRLFIEKDATLLEINPLVKSANGFQALDAKFTFDDAAEKRQKDLFDLRDSAHEVVEEIEAEKYGLVYVRMEGNIGNVVNGAGLAMATNDAISLYGGTSANFLDAGGQATKETMQQAFRIILNDERIKAILVNIYGGIIRCDMIAESIIAAASDLGPMRVPVVVRLQGTNSQAGLKLLEEADLGLHVVADFGEAAKKAVELAKA